MALSSAFEIGQMRQVGVFRKNMPLDNDSGGQDDNFVNLLTTRGHLRKKSGGKGIEEGSLQFNKSYEWVCRYQSDIVIDSDTRLTVDGKDYQIMDFDLNDEVQHLYIFNLNRIDG